MLPATIRQHADADLTEAERFLLRKMKEMNESALKVVLEQLAIIEDQTDNVLRSLFLAQAPADDDDILLMMLKLSATGYESAETDTVDGPQ